MNLPLQHSKNAMQQADFLSNAAQNTVSKTYCKLRIVAKGHLLVIILFLNTGIFSPLFAQNTGDYRSNSTVGSWTTLTDWQFWDGDSWEIPTKYPGENTGMGPVSIMDGHTMTLNGSPEYGISSLTVGEGNSGNLIFGDDNTDRTLRVLGELTVNSGGTLKSAGDGGNKLEIKGNLINNGIFDADDGTGVGADLHVEFYGTSNQTISGSGSISDFSKITINNSGSAGNNIIEVLSSNFTASPGFLTLTNGILKMSGDYTFSNTFFSSGSYTIASGCGLWLNNANVTVTGQDGTPILKGSIQITNGIFNIGTSSGNSLEYGSNALFKMEGGSMTIAGRFNGPITSQPLTFNMSGGDLTVSNVGHYATRASFDIPHTNSSFTMSGGKIIIKNKSTNASPLDYRNLAGTVNITGGTIQFGTAETVGSPDFVVGTTSSATNIFPNLSIVKATGTSTVSFKTNVHVIGEINLASGTNLNIGTNSLSSTGLNSNGTININSTPTNNGSFIPASITQSGTVNYMRYATKTNWHLFSSPVSGQNVSTFLSSNPKVNAAELIGWSETSGAWVYNSNSAFGTFESGIGYGLAQTADGTITFSGSLISTFPLQKTVTLTDNATGYGWNLLGNPFPSSLKITDASDGFLTVNTSSLDDNHKAIYVYDDAIDNYLFIGTETVGFGTDSESSTLTHLQAGQGFFVLAKANGAQFSFTSAMRDHNTTAPYKSAIVNADWAGLQLKVKFDEKMNYTTVVYNKEMTAGLDPGYDIGKLSANPEVEIYTSLVIDNGVNFARQALPAVDADKNVVPVGLASEKGGEITFMAEVIELAGYKFILEDRKTGTFTDLSADTYTVSIPEKTYGTGRFFLHAALATGINPVDTKPFNLKVYASEGHLYINGEVSSRATAAVYDLTGKKIMESKLGDSTRNSFDLPSGASGMYIVKVTDGARVATAKVVF